MTMSKVNKEEVIKAILANKTYTEIAKEYGVKPSTIGFYGQALGIHRQFHSSTKCNKWNIPKIDKFLISKASTIRRNFVAITNVKVSVEWKCTLCNHTWSECFDALRKRVNLKGCPECGYDQYTVFHDILDTINPLSCYFIGAFMAKGHTSNQNAIYFNNPEKSKLEKLAQIISCTSPVTPMDSRKGKNPHYRLSFHSKKISQNLKLYTASGSIPEVIPPEYMHDFIRGYFDFKGYVEHLYANKCPSATDSIRTNLTGNPTIINKIQEAFQRFAKTNAGYISYKGNCTELHLNGIPSNYAFYSWLYNTNVSTLKYVDTKKYNTYLFTKHLMEVKKTLANNHKEENATKAKQIEIIKTALHKDRINKRKAGYVGKLPFLRDVVQPHMLSRKRNQPFLKEILNKLGATK